MQANPEEVRLSLHGIENTLDVDNMGLPREVGRGREMTQGYGVNRRETGIKPEEAGKYLGISSYEYGAVITPRGLYNQVPFPFSDNHPQGINMIPIEKLDDKEPIIGDDISEVARHKVIGGKAETEPFYDRITEKLVSVRMQGEVDSGVYIVIVHGLSKKWLVQYDIDGKIDEIVVPDRTKIKDMAFCLLASGKYTWDSMVVQAPSDKLLSEEEMKKVKLYMFSKEAEDIKPTGVREHTVLWQLNVPKVGKIALFMLDEPREKGLVYFTAFKAEKGIKIVDKKSDQ